MSKKSIAYPKNAVFQSLQNDLKGKDVTLWIRNEEVASGIVQDVNLLQNHDDSTITINGKKHGTDFARIKFNNKDKEIITRMSGWRNYEEEATRGGKTRRRKNKQKSNSKTRRSRRSYRSRRS